MADPTYADGLLLCSTFFLHDGSSRESAVTYAIDVGSNTSDAAALAQFLQDIFTDQWKATTDTEVAITRTTTLLGDGTSTFTTGESTSAPVFGTDNISGTPPNTACLMKLTTGLGGRRNRGRMFLPSMLSRTDVNEMGSIASGKVLTLQAAADVWFDTILATGGGFGLCIANRHYDRAWNIPGRVLLSVTKSPLVAACTIETTAATQRRRMPR